LIVRRGLIELLVVAAVVALIGWASRSAPVAIPGPAPASAVLDCDSARVDGIATGMTAEEVHRRLGPPPHHGELVLETGGKVRWDEYGTRSAEITFTGEPTATYRADGTVFQVFGRRVQLGALTVGPHATQERALQALGPPQKREGRPGQERLVWTGKKSDLVLTFDLAGHLIGALQGPHAMRPGSFCF
jgi:hypothetical protein